MSTSNKGSTGSEGYFMDFQPSLVDHRGALGKIIFINNFSKESQHTLGEVGVSRIVGFFDAPLLEHFLPGCNEIAFCQY